MDAIKGRGTASNPSNRFERLHLEAEPGEGELVGPSTELFRDTTKSILSENESPDINFRFSLNPYRGCEHGCVYCYARPSHEYLSFSAGLDFETKIMVKEDAPDLLRRRLRSPKWQPQVIALSGNTDCYQPCERELCITRRCLEVCRDFRNPVGIITKSSLVCRDIDYLGELAALGAAHVYVSVTTLNSDLARAMEPRASTPARRLAAIAQLSAAGIPVGVMTAPIVPGLNDHEIPQILRAAAAAGARSAGWTLLRLAKPVDELFDSWLESHFPERRVRVMNRIRECRDGAISDSQYGRRMRGAGNYAGHIARLFDSSVGRFGLAEGLPRLDSGSFRRPVEKGDQLPLF